MFKMCLLVFEIQLGVFYAIDTSRTSLLCSMNVQIPYICSMCACSQVLNQSSLTSTINNQHLVYRFFIFKNSIFYFFNFEISKNWRFFSKNLGFFFSKFYLNKRISNFFVEKMTKFVPKKPCLCGTLTMV